VKKLIVSKQKFENIVSHTSVAFLKEPWPQILAKFNTDACTAFILPQPFAELATLWQVFPKF